MLPTPTPIMSPSAQHRNDLSTNFKQEFDHLLTKLSDLHHQKLLKRRTQQDTVHQSSGMSHATSPLPLLLSSAAPLTVPSTSSVSVSAFASPLQLRADVAAQQQCESESESTDTDTDVGTSKDDDLTTLLKLQLVNATAQKRALAKQLESSEKEILDLKQQVTKEHDSSSSNSNSNSNSMEEEVENEKGAEFNIQIFTAMRLKLVALNIGFQGLNAACAEADWKSTAFALSVLCSFRRKLQKRWLARAWQRWCEKTTASRDKQDTVPREIYDALNHTHHLLSAEYASLARQHVRVQEQSRVTLTEQRRQQSLSSEQNVTLRRQLQETTTSIKRLKEEEIAATTKNKNTELTVIVEETINRVGLSQSFHQASLQMKSDMIQMQDDLDVMSTRCLRATQHVEQLKTTITAAVQQSRTKAETERQRIVSIHLLRDVVRSVMRSRSDLRVGFRTWQDVTLRRRYIEETHLLEVDMAREREEAVFALRAREDMQCATTSVAEELVVLKEETRRVRIDNKRLEERHEHEMQLLRSRIVASQQEFDRRILQMQRQMKRERDIFASERAQARTEGRGREAAWRSTAQSATGSLDIALGRIEQMESGRRSTGT